MIISWVRTHGRSRAIADQLGIPAVFLSESTAKKPMPLKYVPAALETVREIRRARPRSVILMLPPLPLLVVVRALFPRLPVIADLHTGVFLDPKWRPFLRPTLRLLRGSTCVVTNHVLQRRCIQAGVDAIVMHDPLPDTIVDSLPGRDGKRSVLCPLGYANDEPITELLQAAGELKGDGVELRLTGKAPEWVRERAPSNVVFTGYLTDADYDSELARCDAVAALTTRDHTMQRAGYEAIGSAKPLITADFPVLRDFHADAAVYVDPSDKAELAAGIRDALTNADELRDLSRKRFDQLRADQAIAIEELRRVVISEEFQTSGIRSNSCAKGRAAG